DQAPLGEGRRGAEVRRRAARDQVRAGREPKALRFDAAARLHSSLPLDPYGCGSRHPRRLQPRPRIPPRLDRGHSAEAARGPGAPTLSDWWAFKIEAYDAIPYNAAIMTRKGVVVSINSDSAEEARHLNQEAAKCIKYGGLSEIEALRLVTLNPAKQLRIDQWVGSIDKGKDADLVLYNHHPFSPTALPQKVWIDG